MQLAKLNGKPEIFYTIQGEGKGLGKPSIFVRTSLCNLHCIWCDTDYTWNWKGTKFSHVNDADPTYEKYDRDKWLEKMPVEEVVTTISRYNCNRVVLTGGEPLLQQTELIALMRSLRQLNDSYWFEVETNGTIIPDVEFDELINQYNVSPKLKNSNNSSKLREKLEAYRYFALNSKSTFKYVIDKKNDLKEVLDLVEKYQLPNENLYLMPQGTSAEELIVKQQWLVEICKEYGFNYTDRLHIQIWGNRRGV